nr:NAC domain-containing protein [Tanacetum cinerariifolium]
MDVKNNLNHLQEMINLINSNQDPPVDLYHLERSDKGDIKIDSLTKKPLDTLLTGDEVIRTTLERENDEFIKSSVDIDLTGDEVISTTLERENDEFIKSSVDIDLTGDEVISTTLERDEVIREEKLNIDLTFGEDLDTFSIRDMELDFNPNRDIEELERLLPDDPVPVLVPRVFDEPLGDDTKPRSYNVTFSNPIFDFNDDYTLCYDIPLFDEDFEDISILDPFESTLVIDESSLLVTPLPDPKQICLKQLNMDVENNLNHLQEMMNLINSNQDPPVDLYHLERSDKGDIKIDSLNKKPLDTLLTRDEVISTTLERENNEFIKSSVDDLVPIPKKSEVTSVCKLECNMPITTHFPTTDVREEKLDINLTFGEDLDTFSIRDRELDFNPSRDIEELEHLLADEPVPVPVLRVFDEPLGDDTKPRSYNVTFSNPLFDFNDDYTLCYDITLFDEDFKDISSLDPFESTLVIDESSLLVTPLLVPKQICLREVERFDLFFSLTQLRERQG